MSSWRPSHCDGLAVPSPAQLQRGLGGPEGSTPRRGLAGGWPLHQWRPVHSVRFQLPLPDPASSANEQALEIRLAAERSGGRSWEGDPIRERPGRALPANEDRVGLEVRVVLDERRHDEDRRGLTGIDRLNVEVDVLVAERAPVAPN